MTSVLWESCLERLKENLSIQDFNTWIRPLQCEESGDSLVLYGPNRFVVEWVREKYLHQFVQLVREELGQDSPRIELLENSKRRQASPVSQVFSQPLSMRSVESAQTGTYRSSVSEKPVVSVANTPSTLNTRREGVQSNPQPSTASSERKLDTRSRVSQQHINRHSSSQTKVSRKKQSVGPGHESRVNPNFNFETFVEGKSNQLARAAAQQVAMNPGKAYNPLFLYGGVGLGKTHLMHAVGNTIQSRRGAKVIYLHSERFVADMVKALQTNAIEEFKNYYRGVDALLIDDIQFFAGKERSQEEFFHTFNALVDAENQVILTCDRYPKEVEGLEERLKSRFGWGLTMAIEPPELEMRVAILKSKAEQSRVDLPNEVAFFIAKRIRSNVRELEGALKRVIANSHFTGKAITVDFVKDALKDLISAQDKLINTENIQKTVAEYYKLKLSDLLSKRRTRSIARPRQVAMALSRELTNQSLPEIGNAFGGRDHTTVLHACSKIKSLKLTDPEIEEDYSNLLRTLSS